MAESLALDIFYSFGCQDLNNKNQLETVVFGEVLFFGNVWTMETGKNITQWDPNKEGWPNLQIFFGLSFLLFC